MFMVISSCRSLFAIYTTRPSAEDLVDTIVQFFPWNGMNDLASLFAVFAGIDLSSYACRQDGHQALAWSSFHRLGKRS